MTGSTPLLLIEDRLETSSTFSTFALVPSSCMVDIATCEKIFRNHSRRRVCRSKFSSDARCDKHLEHNHISFSQCPLSSRFIFLNFPQFHTGCLSSFNTHSLWFFRLSFVVFVAEVASSHVIELCQNIHTTRHYSGKLDQSVSVIRFPRGNGERSIFSYIVHLSGVPQSSNRLLGLACDHGFQMMIHLYTVVHVRCMDCCLE